VYSVASVGSYTLNVTPAVDVVGYVHVTVTFVPSADVAPGFPMVTAVSGVMLSVGTDPNPVPGAPVAATVYTKGGVPLDGIKV